MAGAGYKLFTTGDVLTAADVNTYFMQQTVMSFASAAARTTALSGVLAEGMVSYLQDTNSLEVYDGSAWVGATGDLTALTAGSGISITSPTGPVPTVALNLASANAFTAAQSVTISTGATVPLTITNAGTGNSFLVEDAASTDSTPFVIDASGNTVVGATTALTNNVISGTSKLQVIGSGALASFGLVRTDASTPIISFNSGSSGNNVTSGGALLNISSGGYDGTSYSTAGTIAMRADGTVSTGIVPGRIEFLTANTSGTNAEKMRITSSGRVGIGLQITSSAHLGVTNTQSAADVTVLTRNFAAQTELSWSIQNSATSVIFGVTAAGLIQYVSGNTATTVGAAGGASALPATPTGYLKIDIGGTNYKVPYYAN